nr:MAG TPA: hypothetical protein [Caudoviricetes sp.]
MKYYRFPFCTFFLARFIGCSLLELHVLVLFILITKFILRPHISRPETSRSYIVGELQTYELNVYLVV